METTFPTSPIQFKYGAMQTLKKLGNKRNVKRSVAFNFFFDSEYMNNLHLLTGDDTFERMYELNEAFQEN